MLLTNHAVSNCEDLRERTKTMSRHGDRRGQIADFRGSFETINWLYLLFKCGIKTKTHFDWLLWHSSSLGQLNLEPTQPNCLVGCKVPTVLWRSVSKKPCTWVFIIQMHNMGVKLESKYKHLQIFCGKCPWNVIKISSTNLSRYVFHKIYISYVWYTRNMYTPHNSLMMSPIVPNRPMNYTLKQKRLLFWFPLVAVQVVILTTFTAACDETSIEMTTLSLLCKISIHQTMISSLLIHQR